MKQKDLANGLTSWECIERKKRNCKGKMKLNVINDFGEQVQERTDAPSATRYELTKVRASNERKASITHNTTSKFSAPGWLIEYQLQL